MTSATPHDIAAYRCAACGTELAPYALSCPACHALVFSELLRDLVAKADQCSTRGDLSAAQDALSKALSLLPPGTQQYDAIQARVHSLSATIANAAPAGAPAAKASSGPWWKRGIAGATGALLLALSKLKFLLLGLTKASTFLSMFAFFGVYWSAYGWPLALGLVVSIYIHEMGHVAMLRRLGISAGAPLFVPGLGAVVLLKQRVDDPIIDAKIGLAGPVWGLGAGLAAWLVGAMTGSAPLLAIAQLTGFINLFNLIPVWQLDGSRGFHALGRVDRWIVVAACVVMYLLTSERLLLLVAAVAAYRAFDRAPTRSNRRICATFVGLVASLALLAAINVAR